MLIQPATKSCMMQVPKTPEKDFQTKHLRTLTDRPVLLQQVPVQQFGEVPLQETHRKLTLGKGQLSSYKHGIS